MTSLYSWQTRAHALAAVAWTGLVAAVLIVMAAGPAGAQIETEQVGAPPGRLGLLAATLLFVTWAIAFGIALTRARTRRRAVSSSSGG